MNHDETSEILAAYALDAVEPSEAVAVEVHLRECPRCREELAGHRQTAGVLGSSGAEAPPALWDEITARIRSGVTRPIGERRSVGGARGPGAAPGSVPPGGPAPFGILPLREPVAHPDRGSADTRAVLFRSARHRRMRRITVQGGALLAAAAVVAMVLLGIQLHHLDRRLDRVSGAGATGRVSTAAELALLDPEARRMVLTAAGNDTPEAELVALPSGTAYLLNRDLSALPADETYQLWVSEGARVVSVGVLGVHPTTVAVHLDRVGPPQAFALSIEPAGGSVAPTHPIASSASED